MDATVYGPHQVRNGRHLMRFTGRVLGAGTSERPGVPRWSELVVYGLTNGSYIRSKIGRSLVAHRPECPLVDWHMTPWLELADNGERGVARVPCGVCQPVTGASWDPQTMIESTRYTATVAADPETLDMLLTSTPGGHLPRLVADVVQQVCVADAAFAAYWASRAITNSGEIRHHV